MPAKRYIPVKESKAELKKLLKTKIPFFAPRLRMLLVMKDEGQNVLSKRELADRVGVNHNSIQSWRSLYERAGLDALLSHKRTGFKPTLIEPEEHEGLKEKLNDEQNGLPGYVELLAWFNETYNKSIDYQCLYKYCRRHFNTKIKVARKSHVNKSDEAVEAFKKTLVSI